MKSKKCCCSGASDCCPPKQREIKKLVIDFLYLDLTACERCQGTEAILEEAVADVSHVLKAAGIDTVINKVNITNKELAIKHRFVSSPTIRMNGNDIDMNIKENSCESCGDLCGESCDCRVWTYQGMEYNVPPKAMIVNAMLREAYGSSSPEQVKEYTLPENLARFFDSLEKNRKYDR